MKKLLVSMMILAGFSANYAALADCSNICNNVPNCTSIHIDSFQLKPLHAKSVGSYKCYSGYYIWAICHQSTYNNVNMTYILSSNAANAIVFTYPHLHNTTSVDVYIACSTSSSPNSGGGGEVAG